MDISDIITVLMVILGVVAIFYLIDLYTDKVYKNHSIKELEEVREVIERSLYQRKERDEMIRRFLDMSHSKCMVKTNKKYYSNTKLEDGIMENKIEDQKAMDAINKENEFITRLRDEQEELSEKISKLEVFISTDKFVGLGAEPQFLLTQQLKTMEAYNSILIRRLELLGVAVDE